MIENDRMKKMTFGRGEKIHVLWKVTVENCLQSVSIQFDMYTQDTDLTGLCDGWDEKYLYTMHSSSLLDIINTRIIPKRRILIINIISKHVNF